MLRASLTYGGVLYTTTKSVRVENSRVSAVDYTNYWTGKWNVQAGCNPSTCCCMDGQMVATNEGYNLIQITSNVKGVCLGATSISFYIGNLNSYDTVNTKMGADNMILKKIGSNTVSMTNTANNACNGSAVCSEACPRYKDTASSKSTGTASSLKAEIVLVLVSVLFGIFL